MGERSVAGAKWESLRIAYVCHYFAPEPAAPAARVHELSRAWVSMGQSVTVLTGFPNFPTGRVPPAYRGRLMATEWLDGIRVLRQWLYAAPSQGIRNRLLSHLSFMVTAVVLGLPRLGRVDVVVASSPTLLSAVSAWFIASLRRVPFVLEVRDLWPEAFVELGVMRPGRAVDLLDSLAGFLYARAARVVVVTEAFAERLAARGVPREKLAFIPNGADLALLAAERDRSAARAWLGVPPDGFVAVYVGSHGQSQGLDTVLEAAALRPDVTFLLVGDGSERARLVARRDQRGLANVVMHPGVPRTEVPLVYAAADVCLVPLRAVPILETFIPSKLFEALAAGKPVVGAVRGEARQILERSGGALLAEPGDAHDIARAVGTLRDDPTLRARLARAGQAYVRAHYDRQALAGRYLRLLQQVAQI